MAETVPFFQFFVHHFTAVLAKTFGAGGACTADQ
jgi:hypothetical protein